MNNIFLWEGFGSPFLRRRKLAEGKLMITLELIKIAKVIYAEGSIFSGKNYNALLAIAQCIHDLLPSYKDLNTCLASAFTSPSNQYDPQCLQAAQAVFEQGERRFPDAHILQFRSFTKYSDGHGQPNKVGNQTKKSWQTCTQPMTIWAVTPYQISGDTFILDGKRRKRR